MRNIKLEQDIFSIQNESDFEKMAFRVFHFQVDNVPIYREFCQRINNLSPRTISEIPFLPISFFKSHQIIHENLNAEVVFKSSGTTSQTRSQHHVAFKDVYENSFLNTFSEQIANPEESIILALLPNYIEQGDSSLIYMVDSLIKKSNNSLSGFYLNNQNELIQTIHKARKHNKKIILFGVSYALLDLAENKIDLSGVRVIETGGMKGRRKEMIKSELHEHLSKGLNVSTIYSEYGMTELLSQAYLQSEGFFQSPKWMKTLIRDVNDAFTILEDGKTGGVNIIDLANLYSCSFIATDDLGIKHKDFFKILGRFDLSDIRGCNLLIN